MGIIVLTLYAILFTASYIYFAINTYKEDKVSFGIAITGTIILLLIGIITGDIFSISVVVLGFMFALAI